MGSTGPKKDRALITVSGIRNLPSHRRAEIESRSEVTLSNEAWKKIDSAHRHIDIARDFENSPQINGKSAASYEKSRKRAETRLCKVIKELTNQAAEKAMNSAIDRGQNTPFRKELKEVIRRVGRLHTAIVQADTPEKVSCSLSDAEAKTIKEIATAVASEIPVDAPETLGKQGLSQFQRFVFALGIYKPNAATTDIEEAFAKWLKRKMTSNS